MPDPAELTTVEAQAPGEVVRLKRVVAEVTGGPDKGLTIALGASDAFVGSGADCDLCLTDAYVSRRLFRHGGERPPHVLLRRFLGRPVAPDPLLAEITRAGASHPMRE